MNRWHLKISDEEILEKVIVDGKNTKTQVLEPVGEKRKTSKKKTQGPGR